MKVSVFFDGQNFYRSLQRYDESLRVDYDRLAAWITQAVGGPGAIFAGAHYYVGVSADAPPPFERAPTRMAPSRLARPPAQPASGLTLERALQELQRAEARLPHVSRGYFVMRWKSHQLPPVGADREALVQQMIGAGLAEEFEVKDGEGRSVTAIRSREPNGNVRESDGNIALPG